MDFSSLVGKTIISATLMKRPEFDDTAWLHLSFSDGTHCVLRAGYACYTGDSEDEYPAYISIMDNPPGDLVPVGE